MKPSLFWCYSVIILHYSVRTHACSVTKSCLILYDSMDCSLPGSYNSRQEYYSILSFSSPGDLPDSGIEPLNSWKTLYHRTIWEVPLLRQLHRYYGSLHFRTTSLDDAGWETQKPMTILRIYRLWHHLSNKLPGLSSLARLCLSYFRILWGYVAARQRDERTTVKLNVSELREGNTPLRSWYDESFYVRMFCSEKS